MPFRVSGKNLDVGDALRARVSDRIAEAMGKYFDGGYSGHVTLAREGFGFRTECAIHLDSKITLEAEGMAPDAYASADQALAEAVQQRAVIETRFTRDQRDCYRKFFTTSCLDDAKERRRIALGQVRAVEVEANSYKRHARVRERDKALEERRAQEESEAPQRIKAQAEAEAKQPN